MSLTKISTGMLKADAASVDLNIDAGTLFLDVANNRVGVANTSPSVSLHVSGGAGSTILNDSTSWSYLRLKSPNANGGYIQFADADDDDVGQIFYYHGSGGDYMSFTTNASERVRINSSGNVGIGTTNPQAALHAVGNILSSGTVQIFPSAAGAASVQMQRQGQGTAWSLAQGNTATDMFEILRGSSSYFAVNSSGNVGIGTISPNYLLDVEGTGSLFRIHSTSGASVLQLQVSDTTSINDINFGDTGATARGQIRYRHNGDSLAMSTAGTERLRIDSSGTFLVGKTSSNISSDGVELGTRVDSTADGTYALRLNRRNSGGVIAQFRKDGSVVGEIGSNSSRFFIHNNYGSGAGIRFDNASLRPSTATGASEDATTDLGVSGARFKDLHLSGVAYVGAVVTTSSVRSFDGSASAASFNSINDINTGLFFPAANNLAVTTDGTERLRIDAFGNVGIGTTSPGSLLHVYDGNIQLQSPSGSGGRYISLNNTHTGGRDYRLTSTSDSHGSLGGGDFAILDNDVSGNDAAKTRLLINGSGSVGIGTTSPSGAKLHVAGGIKGTDLIAHDSTGINLQTDEGTKRLVVTDAGNIGIGTANPGSLLTVEGDIRQTDGDLLYTGGGNYNIRHLINDQSITFDTSTGGTTSEKMRVRGDGNVGIGTTSPSSVLHISDASSPEIRLEDSDATSTFNQIAFQNAAGNFNLNTRQDNGTFVSTDYQIIKNASGANIHKWFIGNSEKLRLDASGRVLINTTSSIDNFAKLQVVSDSSGYARITLQDVDGTDQKTYFQQSGGGTAITTQNGTSNGNFDVNGWNGSATSYFFRVASSGNVGIGTTSPTRKLHVQSAGSAPCALFGNSAHNNSIELTRITSAASYIALQAYSSTGGLVGGPTLTFSTANSGGGSVAERMRIASTGDVGIGTTSPQTRFHVESSDGSGIRVSRSGASAYLQLFPAYSNVPTIMGLGAGGLHLGYNSSTAGIRISTGNKVGIGTTSPARQVHLHDASGDNNLHITNSTTGATASDGFSVVSQSGTNDVILNQRETANLRIHTANTERIRIASNNPYMFLGHTGHSWGTFDAVAQIGRTGFIANYDAEGTSNQQTVIANNTYYGTSGYTSIEGATGAAYMNLMSGDARFFTAPATTAGSAQTFTQRLTLTNGGNVGIGTTNPAKKLHVDGIIASQNSAQGTGLLQLQGYGNVAYINHSGSSSLYFRMGSSFDTRMTLANDGRLGIGTTAPNAKLEIKGASGVNYLKFIDSSNTELFRIDSNFRWAIGTTTPTQKFHFKGGANENIKLRLEPGLTAGNVGALQVGRTDGSGNPIVTDAVTGGVPIPGVAGIMLGSTTSGLHAVGIQTPNSSAGHIVFKPKGVEKVRIQATGGISFNGDTAAANALDDYEEGSFTPVLTREGASSNATITLESARYVKIGGVVTVTFYISAISNFPTDGTLAKITGFPFTANSWQSGTIAYGTSTNASATNWALNGNTGYLLNSNGNGFRGGAVDLNRGMFSMTYTTNS